MKTNAPSQKPERLASPKLPMGSALPPGLYVAATPIGNLGDASSRLQQVLACADLVLCEDTRVTGRLMQALAVKTPLRRYDDHQGDHVRPEILDQLAAGQAIVLVSDAGTPLIADPGFKLVRDARAQGLSVFTVPGPCAAIAALSIAGVPTDRFTFQGFLPAKQGARRTLLDTLSARGETVVTYETAPRLAAALRDIADIYGPGPVVITRELTKLYEEVIEGDAAALAARFEAKPTKGEIVLVIPPRAVVAVTLEDADDAMQLALKTLSLKDAAAQVAEETGLKKRDLYQRWVQRDR